MTTITIPTDTVTTTVLSIITLLIIQTIKKGTTLTATVITTVIDIQKISQTTHIEEIIGFVLITLIVTVLEEFIFNCRTKRLVKSLG